MFLSPPPCPHALDLARYALVAQATLPSPALDGASALVWRAPAGGGTGTGAGTLLVLPDSGTVMVEVTEHNPVARWGSNSLISDNGVVFPADRSGDADYSGLPALQGPAGHEGEVLAMLKGLNEKFAKGRVAVVDLRLSDRLAWRAVLSDGLEVVYGNKDPLAATERMLSVLLRLAEYHPGTLKRLDFRYRSGFAVTFNPVVTAPPVERNATPKSG
jgi:cell division protein FtsQ